MEMACTAELPLIPCLASELSQVFLNIIVNSAEAINDMSEGRKKEMGKIAIRTTKIPHGVEIRITDTGGGIPDQIQERVFNLIRFKTCIVGGEKDFHRGISPTIRRRAISFPALPAW
jgi:signal transduction histidine kinase